MIPLTKPYLDNRESEAVAKVLSSNHLTTGKECQAFEEELGEYLGGQAVVCSSCTAALYMLLKRIKTGSIIVSDFTFPSVIKCIRSTNHTPIFMEVRYDTYNSSYENVINALIEQKLSDLRGIIITHQFGLPCNIEFDMDNCIIIEDAACAIGSKLPELKHQIRCFSFHPRKVLTTGEGGVVVSREQYFINQIKQMRSNTINTEDSFNFRMTDIQAAIGRVQLKKLDEHIALRKRVVKYYYQLFGQMKNRIDYPSYNESWNCQNLMVVLPLSANSIIRKMKEYDIETQIGSYVNSGDIKYFAESDRKNPSYLLSIYGLSLPVYYDMTKQEVEYVIEKLDNCL